MPEQKNEDCGKISLHDVIIEEMEAILGKPARDEILTLDEHSQSDLSMQETASIFQTLEQRYGRQGGRGIALQIGRGTFFSILQHEGQHIGLLDQDCRLLPKSQRVKTSFALFARVFSTDWCISAEFTDHDSYWQWQSDENHRYFFIGFLEECLTWIHADKVFQFDCTECIPVAKNACIHINKIPLNY